MAPGRDTMCVRQDLAAPGAIGPHVTDDKGSGAHDDLAIWEIVTVGDVPGSLSTRVSTQSTSPDAGGIAVGAGLCVNNLQRDKNKMLNSTGRQWEDVAWVLHLPFPRRDFDITLPAEKKQLFRRVWTPSTGVGYYLSESPFLHFDIHVSPATDLPGNPTVQYTGGTHPYVKLPQSIQNLRIGDQAGLGPWKQPPRLDGDEKHLPPHFAVLLENGAEIGGHIYSGAALKVRRP
jgi:hypothetical protein